MALKSKWVVTVPPSRLVGRVLDRREVVDFAFFGHDDDAARVLAGGPLDADQAAGQAADFSLGGELFLFP